MDGKGRRQRTRRVRAEDPSVLVAKRERVATAGAVDQVSRYFQPGEDLSHPRDVIADFFWEQRRVPTRRIP